MHRSSRLRSLLLGSCLLFSLLLSLVQGAALYGALAGETRPEQALQTLSTYWPLLLPPLLALLFGWVLHHYLAGRLLALLRRSGRQPLHADALDSLEAAFGTLEQEALLTRNRDARLLDALPLPAWRLDETRQAVLFSQAWKAFSGLLRGEGLQDGWLQLIHAEDRGLLQEALARADQQAGEVRLRLRRADGRYRRSRLYIQPLQGADGRREGSLLSALDVQEQEEAGQARANDEARFRGLVEHSMVGVYLLRGTSLEYVNPRMAEWFGYDARELVGVPFAALASEECRSEVERLLAAQLAGETAQLHHEFTALRRDGEPFIVEIFGTRILVDGEAAVIGSLLDITRRRHDSEALQTVVDAVQASPVVLLRRSLQPGWPITFVSSNVTRWGLDTKALSLGQRRFCTLIHPDDLSAVLAEVEQALAERRSEFVLEYRLRSGVGSYLWIADHISVQRDEEGRVLFLEGLLLDISARRASEEKLRHAAAIFTHAREGVVITDTTPRIIAVNRAYTEITGYAEHELLGLNPNVVSSGRQSAAFYQEMWRVLAEEGSWQGEIWNRRKNGEIFPQWHSISAIRDEQGQLTHYVAVFTDISVLRNAETRLEWLLNHEPLTGLASRTALLDRLQAALERGRTLALVCLEIEGFAALADQLGLAGADALQQQLGAALAPLASGGDLLGCVQPGRFMLLLESAQAQAQLESLASRCQSLCAGLALAPGAMLRLAIRHAAPGQYEAQALWRDLCLDLAGPGSSRIALGVPAAD